MSFRAMGAALGAGTNCRSCSPEVDAIVRIEHRQKTWTTRREIDRPRFGVSVGGVEEGVGRPGSFALSCADVHLVPDFLMPCHELRKN